MYLHINKNILVLMTALLLFSCQSNDGSKTKADDNKSMLIKEKLVDRSLETPSDSALYKNPDLPVMDRVRDLISYMTSGPIVAAVLEKTNAVEEIALKAISKKTGARGLRSILENILLKTMFDLPGQTNIEEVVIDIGVAKGENEPIIVYSKNNKIKSEKTSAA